MATAIRWKTFQEHPISNMVKLLREFDRVGGAVIGASAQAREAGFDYAVKLAIKVVMAGVVVALIELMMCMVFSISNPQWSYIASAGGGLMLFIVAGWLYPGKVEFTLAFIIGIGLVALAGAGAGIHGVAINATISGVTPALFVASSALFAIHTLVRVSEVLARAFPVAESLPQGTFPKIGKLRRMGLLTADEAARLKTANRQNAVTIYVLMFLATAVFIVGLLNLGPDMSNVAVLIPASCVALVLWVVMFALGIPGERNAIKIRREVIARLKQEGILQRVAETVTTTKGWSLNGVVYPTEPEIVSVRTETIRQE